MILAFIQFIARSYIFSNKPESSILEIYIETLGEGDSYGIYVSEDGSIEAIKGKVKDITAENGVTWNKITDRQKIQLTDAQYNEILSLAIELDSIPYEIVPGFITFAEPLIGVWYNNKSYSTYHSEVALYEIVSKIIEYSPLPIDPLPSLPTVIR